MRFPRVQGRTSIYGLIACSAALSGCDPNGSSTGSDYRGRVGRISPEVTIGADLTAAPEYQFSGVTFVEGDGRGGVWVVDGAGTPTPAIRNFDVSGEFTRRLGAVGDGPGEFRSPDEVELLADGAVAVRDPGAPGRLTVFRADGSLEAVVGLGSVRQVLRSGAGLYAGNDGLLWFSYKGVGRLSRTRAGTRYARLTPNWEVQDTVMPPELLASTAQTVSITTVTGSERRYRIAYQPRRVSAWHPDGKFIVGRGDSATLAILRPVIDPGTRRADSASYVLESTVSLMDVRPHVGSDERRHERRELEISLRGASDRAKVPTVPETPDTKPVWRSFFVANDTLLVVRPHMPSTRVGDDWVEPEVADFYRLPDGTHLGRIEIPDGSRATRSSMSIDGNLVWLLGRDHLGIESLTRYVLVWKG